MKIIDTSGRLRPLWPQNKRLHLPRTTDRLHTRQDRWIQEQAFTPAKNATKPNAFKIIPLQRTRKENNWETKETMERATLTLETERAKWPNPGCLWWWYSMNYSVWHTFIFLIIIPCYMFRPPGPSSGLLCWVILWCFILGVFRIWSEYRLSWLRSFEILFTFLQSCYPGSTLVVRVFLY
jgi:hypothetical protein